MCEVIRMDVGYLTALAKQRTATTPNWNDAVDRLTYYSRSIEADLAEFLSEAHLTEDIGRLERIGSLVNDIVVNAAAIHVAVIDRVERLQKRAS